MPGKIINTITRDRLQLLILNCPKNRQMNKKKYDKLNNTRGKIERTIIHRIQALYYDNLGKRPGKIICQFFDEKLAIFIEDFIIPAEQFLLNNERQEFAKELRSQLDAAIKPLLQKIIADVTGVEVVAMLSDSGLNHKIAGFIAVLSDIPEIRDPESIPKVKKEKLADTGNDKQ